MEAEQPYGPWNIRMSASERKNIRKKIIKGGRIADEIRKMAKDHHESHEVPAAEKFMEQEIQEIPQSPSEDTSPQIALKTLHSRSFSQKLLDIIKKIFLP